jgi:hypothetical protein
MRRSCAASGARSNPPARGDIPFPHGCRDRSPGYRDSVAVDHFELLAWLVEREDAEPGVELSGSTLLAKAGHLNKGDQPGAVEIARAAAQLRLRHWIDWRFTGAPGPLSEPPANALNDRDLHHVDRIIVTCAGHQVLTTRRVPAPTQQINIIQSTVDRRPSTVDRRPVGSRRHREHRPVRDPRSR